MPGIRFQCQLVSGGEDSKFDLWWYPSRHHPIRLLRQLIRERLQQLWPDKSRHNDSIRLFFNGQQLEDQYSIQTYDLSQDDVIHVMLTSPSTTSSNTVQSLSNDNSNIDHHHQSIDQDDYYKVGDHVDAFEPETGSWFPARIVRMTKSTTDQTVNYCVTFRKQSLGCDQIRRLSQIRPQPYRMIEKDKLQPGQTVMAYIQHDHQWYAAAVEMIKHSRQAFCMRIWLALVTHGSEMPIIRQQIRYRHGHIYHLESNVPIAERCSQLDSIVRNGSAIDRYIEPDCDQCADNAAIQQCSKCGCHICRMKTDPDKQLVCDECERPTHMWCLAKPLDRIPDNDDDWYCDECRNETTEDLLQQQQSHLQQRQQNNRSTGWGYGMACAARSKHRNRVESQTFGAIAGVPVGSWWRFRVQASEAGVHAPLVAGIHGSQSLGVYSLVFAAINPQDVDLGDEIYYTANNSRNIGHSSAAADDNRRLERDALALARNCPVPVNEQYGATANGPDRNLWKQGPPIRVLRSGNGRRPAKHGRRSRFLPKIGVRYDGLYKVVSYWCEAATNGHRIWRFLLRRDDAQPAPWTDAGRYRMKKLGLQLQYPPGWCRSIAQKRFWTIDSGIRAKQSRTILSNQIQSEADQPITEKYDIPKSLIKLIDNDSANRQAWANILAQQYANREQFLTIVRQTFRCACCMDTGDNQMMITTECGHNFCGVCLEQYLQTQQHSPTNSKPVCPVCRSDCFITQQNCLPKANTILSQILQSLSESN